jgi:hypothetical protein
VLIVKGRLVVFKMTVPGPEGNAIFPAAAASEGKGPEAAGRVETTLGLEGFETSMEITDEGPIGFAFMTWT